MEKRKLIVGTYTGAWVRFVKEGQTIGFAQGDRSPNFKNKGVPEWTFKRIRMVQGFDSNDLQGSRAQCFDPKTKKRFEEVTIKQLMLTSTDGVIQFSVKLF